jgi:hypothetical protein
VSGPCNGQHDDCPWCDVAAEAETGRFELRFDDGQQTVHTVEQAQAVADRLLEHSDRLDEGER